MYKFGKRSTKNLSECHIDLQTIYNEVIKIINCSIIEGHRSCEEQNKLFHAGKSKVRFPNSKHNANPSLAVDAVPYPINWNDTKSFYYFSGIVKGVAERLYVEGKIGHKTRWGGDWNSNNDLNDQTFFDLPHIELIPNV